MLQRNHSFCSNGRRRRSVAVDECAVGLAQPAFGTDEPGAVAGAVVSIALAVPATSGIAAACRYRRRRRCRARSLVLTSSPLLVCRPATVGRAADLHWLDCDRRPASWSRDRNLGGCAREGKRCGKKDEWSTHFRCGSQVAASVVRCLAAGSRSALDARAGRRFIAIRALRRTKLTATVLPSRIGSEDNAQSSIDA